MLVLDVRRLRALRALADRGTIAAAADVLGLTPSAVSQQLAALEREVGRPLLEPAGRSVRLTAAARVLLEHADGLFAQLERLDADLASHDASGGVVRVGGRGDRTALVERVQRAQAADVEHQPILRVLARIATRSGGCGSRGCHSCPPGTSSWPWPSRSSGA